MMIPLKITRVGLRARTAIGHGRRSQARNGTWIAAQSRRTIAVVKPAGAFSLPNLPSTRPAIRGAMPDAMRMAENLKLEWLESARFGKPGHQVLAPK